MDTLLTAINTTAFCLSFTIVLMHHLKQRKIFKAGLFFAFAFILEIACDLWLPALAPFTFYFTAAIAGGLIGRERHLIYGLHISINALMAFQWIIAFLGSLVFILFPEENLFYNVSYNICMASALIMASWLLCRRQKLFILGTASRKLLLLDTIVSLLFIFLLNYALPMFFLAMGTLNYGKIGIVILIIIAVNVLHRNYTFTLEKEADQTRWALHLLNARTKVTVGKYKELFEIKGAYVPPYEKAAALIPQIDAVDVP